MSHFTLTPSGPFSLAAAAGFVAGFGPAGRPDADGGPVFRLAFVRDDLAGAAGVALREEAGTVRGTMFGPASDPDAVAGQIARILSLDHDGEGFAAVGARDSVVGRLQRAHPGLRPVLFSSPYEAAAWAVISARQRVPQAVRVRERLEAAAGEPVDVQGEVMPTFPTPRRLLDVSAVPGLSEQQLERLHAVARAALEGRLDPARLRALAPEEALAELRTLPGIGPFYAGLVLVRATGVADVLPPDEPRVRAAAARAYGLREPPEGEAWERLAQPWRPFRTWVCLLLRVGA